MIELIKTLELEFFEEILEFHGVDLLKELINIMDYKFLQANEILFQKKTVANFCYVILEGNIGCYINDINLIKRRLKKKIRHKQSNESPDIKRNITEISDYSKGEIIAEYAILSDGSEKHSLTAITKENCYLICFEKNSYRNTVCKILSLNYSNRIIYIFLSKK